MIKYYEKLLNFLIRKTNNIINKKFIIENPNWEYLSLWTSEYYFTFKKLPTFNIKVKEEKNFILKSYYMGKNFYKNKLLKDIIKLVILNFKLIKLKNR